MSQNATIDFTLGTLGHFPAEVRSYIFGYVLDFNHIQGSAAQALQAREASTPEKNRTALLRTSKAIYAESKRILINVNDFCIFVEPGDAIGPYSPSFDLHTGQTGWRYVMQHAALGREFNSFEFDHFLSNESAKYLRNVEIHIGPDVTEADIAPRNVQSEAGSETSAFLSLTEALSLVNIVLLSRSVSLQHLDIYIRCTQERLENLPLLLDEIARIRGVRKADVLVSGDNGQTGRIVWTLKRNYSKYLEEVMSQRPFSEALPFVPDEDGIFHTIDAEEDEEDEEDVLEVDPEDRALMDEFGMDEDEVRNLRDQGLLDLDLIDYYDDLEVDEFLGH